MKKKILVLFLALALLGCMFPTALADGDIFTDVPAGEWFEQGVITCAQKGVMIGVGDGLFVPDKELTNAECLTLAFRLFDLVRGTEHTVEQASEDWGKLTLTLADGTVFEGYGYLGGSDGIFSWWSGRNGYEGVCVQVPGEYNPGASGSVPADQTQRAWMDAHPDVCGSGCPAALTLNGVTYEGTTDCWIPVGPYVFMFQPEVGKRDEVNAILHHAVYREMGPEYWWRDICYTIAQRDLEDIFDPLQFTNDPANRGFFAKLLAAGSSGSLEKRFTVEAIPDLPREENGTQADDYRAAVYTLYEAGVLTGTDENGTFDAEGSLTRAQSAVMAARVLDESQRLTTPPKGNAAQGA